MGYRLRYRNPKIVKYTHSAASGKKLKNKYVVVEGTKLISTVRGLTKTEAKKQLVNAKKERIFVFSG
jgi:hypothetical protein